MEAMGAVCLASRSNTTRWRTVDLSTKASRLYKVSENGQYKSVLNVTLNTMFFYSVAPLLPKLC